MTAVVAAALLGAGVVPGARAGSPSGTCSTDWPAYQHDAARSGAVDAGCAAITAANVATLVPRWFARTSAAVTATPAVVGSRVFVGDAGGTFHAFDAATGNEVWQRTIAATMDTNTGAPDTHRSSFGAFVSSPAYGLVNSSDPTSATLFVGGGGTVYAINAADGGLRWATNLDPTHPTSPLEVESSPALWTDPAGGLHVLVGDDVNESPGNVATGLLELDAATGALQWEFAPELGAAVNTLPSDQSKGFGCGDVWTSPSVDPTPTATAADGVAYFASGNCADPAGAAAAGVVVTSEAVWAVSLLDGSRQWAFSEGGTPAEQRYGGDDDFGASPTVISLPAGTTMTCGTSPTSRVVLEASKTGSAYALDPDTGSACWSSQAAQPGQTGPVAAGAVGGFIGSGAVGLAGTNTAWFGPSAVPLPFAGHGPTSSDGPQLDPTLATDPARATSLHAIDVATGRTLWDAATAAPSYAAATYSGGVVFAPGTTSFSAAAYDAATGLPLWHAVLGGAPSSGVAVAGAHVFVGVGTSFGGQPPQAMGVWSFGLPGS